MTSDGPNPEGVWQHGWLRALTTQYETRARQTPVESQRIIDAAVHAQLVFPGPIGQLIARELRSYAELSWLAPPDGLLERVIGAVLERPVPNAGQEGDRPPTHGFGERGENGRDCEPMGTPKPRRTSRLCDENF